MEWPRRLARPEGNTVAFLGRGFVGDDVRSPREGGMGRIGDSEYWDYKIVLVLALPKGIASFSPGLSRRAGWLPWGAHEKNPPTLKGVAPVCEW
jgi:hypothetical protein